MAFNGSLRVPRQGSLFPPCWGLPIPPDENSAGRLDSGRMDPPTFPSDISGEFSEKIEILRLSSFNTQNDPLEILNKMRPILIFSIFFVSATFLEKYVSADFPGKNDFSGFMWVV